MFDFTLRNGITIPAVGFGTYKAAEDGVENLVTALDVGYRHFDTASFYETEEALREAIRRSGISRKELFLTSKAWMDETGAGAYEACERTLQRLGTDYLDLYLIHWPAFTGNWEEDRARDRETWTAFQKLYRDGKVRAIGVSNFLPHHLMDLAQLGGEQPQVDQLELHPGHGQDAAVEYCRAQGILPEAWSPLGRARMLREPLLGELAEKYGKSPAQICLCFCLQQGLLPLPKASSRERMRENLDIFDITLSDSDLSRLRTLPPMGWSGEHPDRENVAPDVR